MFDNLFQQIALNDKSYGLGETITIDDIYIIYTCRYLEGYSVLGCISLHKAYSAKSYSEWNDHLTLCAIHYVW